MLKYEVGIGEVYLDVFLNRFQGELVSLKFCLVLFLKKVVKKVTSPALQLLVRLLVRHSPTSPQCLYNMLCSGNLISDEQVKQL